MTFFRWTIRTGVINCQEKKLELIEGQAIWLYHKGNRFEGLMLRKGSYEKVAKKRDNLVRKLDESNPDVSVNH